MNVEMPANVASKLEPNEIKANPQNHFADKLQKYTINDAIDLLAYLFESDTNDIEQTIDEYLAVVQKNHTLETDEHGNMLLPKTAVDRLVDLHVDSIETQSPKHQ